MSAPPPATSLSRLLPPRLSAVILAIDLVAIVLSFAIVVNLPDLWESAARLIDFRPRAIDLELRSYYFGFFCLLMLAGFAHRGHYTRRVPWWSQIQVILKFSGIAMILDGFTYFSLQQPYSRYLVFGNWLLMTALLLLGRRLSFMLLYRSPHWRLPVVLVGDAQIVVDSFFAFYADGLTGYEVKKVLLHSAPGETLDLGFLPKEHPPVEIVAASDNTVDFIRDNPRYFYIISLDRFRGERRDQLMQTLEDTGRDYAIIPPTKRLHMYGMEPHYFFGNDIMLLHKRYSITAPLGRAGKRALDILVSGLSLPFLGLFTAIVFLMKKFEGSDTPVFYGGERIGIHGRMFPCWKFCTMKRNADTVLGELLASDPAAREEWEKFQKLRDDPRIDSSISKLLRKISLDELPQLWNVFRGDMSLVGPRPILPNQTEEYGGTYRQYISVRPGLTGLWQVSGRNETSFQQRIVWDSWYIRNWTLWHDVVILFKTVRVFLTGSGAY